MARESMERDRLVEELREQQLRDQRERERRVDRVVESAVKEDVAAIALKAVQSLRLSLEGGEPKFSTPDPREGVEKSQNSREAADPHGEDRKEAVDPQSEEGKEAADLQKVERKEAVDPQRTRDFLEVQ